MKTLEAQIRKLAVKAQDVSYGIWADAISLADCLAAGEVSIDEAQRQLEELSDSLDDAANNN